MITAAEKQKTSDFIFAISDQSKNEVFYIRDFGAKTNAIINLDDWSKIVQILQLISGEGFREYNESEMIMAKKRVISVLFERIFNDRRKK